MSDSPIEAVNSPAFELIEPVELRSPLVFSSPHSGRDYSESFLAESRLSLGSLRRSEDAYVDELFAAATEIGAPMLRALFPRALLDVNREPYELDPKLFDEPLPSFANTRSLRVAAGLGTIPRVVSDAREIYEKPLSLAVAMRRIETFYKPYHGALRHLMEQAQQRFGLAVLIDCHSMPSISARHPAMSDRRHIDLVIGDRYGASAAPALVDGVQSRLRELGYHVLRNRPYAGGFITEHYGRPSAGWHAIQIEVSRGLYMNETSYEKTERFPLVACHLAEIVRGLAHDVAHGAHLGATRQAAAE